MCNKKVDGVDNYFGINFYNLGKALTNYYFMDLKE